MYSDEELLPLSALQHYIFCKRQCALIHIEQVWVENAHTAEGRAMHDRVHDEGHATVAGVCLERGLALVSRSLGISGKSDIVEFRAGSGGVFIPFPVEYKRGRPKQDESDTVQLCAQAICLEEMLNVPVPCGSIFYGKTRHRHDFELTPQLRKTTEDTALGLHLLIAAGITPKAEYSPKCKSCSLIDICLPKSLSCDTKTETYLREAIADL